MKAIANEAQTHQNRHVKQALIDLRDHNRGLFRVAVRIALLPEQREDSWELFRPIVLDGIEGGDEALVDLVVHGVLERAEPPSFGHSTVYDAARRFILQSEGNRGERLNAHTPNEVKYLIESCAKRIRSIDPESAPFDEVLLVLGFVGEHLSIDEAHLGLCVAAALLLSPNVSSNLAPKWRDRLICAAKKAGKKGEEFHADFLAIALNNAIAYFGVDQRWTDQILHELRELYEKHGETDSAVREAFAKGLAMQVVLFLKAGYLVKAQAVYDELSVLYEKHADDDGVGSAWVGINTLITGSDAGDEEGGEG